MIHQGPVAVIADVIGSRQQPDRSDLQQQVEEVLVQVADAVTPEVPFRATVGDEFQAVYATRNEALRATLIAGLLPRHGNLLRFGLGAGEIGPVPSATSEHIEDGPGWWHAREAVETVEERQSRFPFLRSWYVSAYPEQDTPINAYLLTRDQLLERLSLRARDYARGVARGDSQKTVAAAYGVSQPAVSKLLRDSGAHAVIEGFRMLS